MRKEDNNVPMDEITINGNRWFTRAQLARFYKVSMQTTYNWQRIGWLEEKKIEGVKFFRRKEKCRSLIMTSARPISLKM